MSKREDKLRALEEMSRGAKKLDEVSEAVPEQLDEVTELVSESLKEEVLEAAAEQSDRAKAVAAAEQPKLAVDEKTSGGSFDDDFDFIKCKFDGDGIKAPESLSKEAIMAKISEMKQGADPYAATSDGFKTVTASRGVDSARGKASNGAKPSASRNRRRAMYSIAACLLAVVLVIPSILNYIERPPSTDMVDGKLKTFKSEREVKNLIKSLDYNYGGFSFFGLGSQKDILENAVEDGAAATEEVAENAETPTATMGGDHSETYIQVAGVDEADIVKTDGKYIYAVSGDNDIYIWKADEGKTEKVATLSYFDQNGYVSNLYLYDGKLVVVGTRYDPGWHSVNNRVFAAIYDISNPEEPELIKEFEQSGYISTSRLTGGKLYIVTEYRASQERCIPFVTNGLEYAAMKLVDICCFPNPTTPTYVVVSSVDVDNEKEIRSRSKAVFGATENAYCTTENLYITNTQYNYIAGGIDNSATYDNQTSTLIAKIALNDGKLEFTETGKVRGYVYDQWALDEKDGNLRVATTSTRNGRDVNNLYVLDEKLNQIGEVTGFAKDEHIEAVRFMGDKAYVITFERTDPLFILDLSNPKDPRIDGEVEIEGFSTLLVPTDPGRLVGIGYSTFENEWGGVQTNGVKLALFDISNPSEPRVLDSINFTNANSQAQFTHKALLQNRKAGYLAIPFGYSYYDYMEGEWVMEEEVVDGEGEEVTAGDIAEPSSGSEAGDSGKAASEIRDIEKEINPEKKNIELGGVLVFGADDKINVKDVHQTGKYASKRCIYIGDYIYALDDFDEIVAFEVK